MNTVFVSVLSLLVLIQGQNDFDQSSAHEERSTEDTKESQDSTKVDDSDIMLLAGSGDKVRADNILTGMEILKESPFEAMRTEFDIPELNQGIPNDENTSDEVNSERASERDRESSAREEHSAEANERTSDEEMKTKVETDYFESIDETKSDWDVLEKFLSNRRMMRNEKVSSKLKAEQREVDRRSGQNEENVLEGKENPTQVNVPIAYSGPQYQCCVNMPNNPRPYLSIPKDPIIAPYISAPYTPYPIQARGYNFPPQNNLKLKSAEAEIQKWIKNEYPLGSTIIPLTNVIPNKDAIESLQLQPIPNYQTQQAPLYNPYMAGLM